MKNSIKIFFVGFIVQIACLSLIHAEENLSLQDFPHYQVTEQSQIYPMIEKAYVDLFKSTLNKSLCPTVGDTANLAMSLGLTIEKSSEIASLCHQKNQNLTKYFTRKYTVIFDLEKKIHFDSWTNKSGMTYLVFDKGVSSEKLKLMLLHELAISLDSKFKMFYTGFLMHQNTTKSITMDIDDPIVKVFNYSHRDDFSHAFAIARANNFERYYLNQKLVGENNHEECAEEFKKNLAFIQTTQSSDFVKKTTHDLLGSLLDQMDQAGSEKLNTSNYDEHLNMMISPKLILNDFNLGRVSFCQYMSFPMFSTKSYYSMLANGPRPRTGGGWGGEDGGGDSGGDASALVEKDLLNQQK